MANDVTALKAALITIFKSLPNSAEDAAKRIANAFAVFPTVTVFDTGSYLLAMSGTGFGSTGQFIEWFGVRPTNADLSLCTEANAIFYTKTDGTVSFGSGTGSPVPLSTVTAKGDLIAATGNAAVARVGVGADGTVLVADSGAASGVSWGNISLVGSGKIHNVLFGSPTIALSYGLAPSGVSHPATGFFQVNVPGLTVSGVVHITAVDPGLGLGGGRWASIVVNNGNFVVRLADTANGDVDGDFYYTIAHL